MLHKLITISLVVFLCGCATRAKYEAILNGWIGASEDELVTKWGAPSQTYTTQKGNKILTYVDKTDETVLLPNGLPYEVSRSCKTTFTVNPSGVIERYAIEGSDCVSSER